MKTERLEESTLPANLLNNLTGKEWLLFSKSWFVLNPLRRDFKQLHPASFPEEIPQSFIGFFTKPGQWVLDPFVGTGSSILAARRLGRNAVGVELYPRFAEVAQARMRIEKHDKGGKSVLIVGDSRKLRIMFADYGLPSVDLCVTSPPYWNQLKANHRRQLSRSIVGLATSYGARSEDLGNVSDYKRFLDEQEKVFDAVYDVMGSGGFLVVVTNNVYRERQLWPLAFDTFARLSKKWEPKDEKIWVQDNKPLFPFAIFRNYVANRCHHYCLVFRKPLD